MKNTSFKRAETLFQLERYQEAEEEFRKALETKPGSAEIRSHISLVLCAQKKYAQALEQSREIIADHPEYDNGYYLQALALKELKALDEAEESALQCLKLNPFFPSLYGLLSAIYLGKEDFEKAHGYALRGLQFDKDNQECLQCLVFTLDVLGKKEDAEEVLQRLFDVNANDPSIMRSAGLFYLRNGEAQKALRFFLEALRMNPEDDSSRKLVIEALNAQSIFYLFSNMLEKKSLQWSTSLQRMTSRNRAVHYLLVSILGVKQQWSESLFVLVRSILFFGSVVAFFGIIRFLLFQLPEETRYNYAPLLVLLIFLPIVLLEAHRWFILYGIRTSSLYSFILSPNEKVAHVLLAIKILSFFPMFLIAFFKSAFIVIATFVVYGLLSLLESYFENPHTKMTHLFFVLLMLTMCFTATIVYESTGFGIVFFLILWVSKMTFEKIGT